MDNDTNNDTSVVEHKDEHALDAKTVKRLVEAILFASAEPLSVAILHERLPEGTDIGKALMDLRNDYDGRGVALVEVDRCWAFRTAPDLSEALSIERTVEKKMSPAALETLAIIAYHQPVTRADIENIRGVTASKSTLDLIFDVGWVKPGRRRESPGRPLTWVTTTQFLDHFGLTSLIDLPGIEDLKASGMLDRRPAIDALASGDLFGEEAENAALDKDLTQTRQESLENIIKEEQN